MEKACFRVLVSGRVQGVFYRANTRRIALENNVSGWVRNLPDGRVEIQLEGDIESVGKVIGWAIKGPTHAYVERIEAFRTQCEGARGFQIIY